MRSPEHHTKSPKESQYGKAPNLHNPKWPPNFNTRDHGSAAILTYIQSSGKQTHVLPSLPCKMARKTSTPMQIMCYEKKKVVM